MTNLVATAQFVPPVTPDEVTNCSASQVQNTGTSAIGDLQVIVWDGDEPGISFIDHSSTPATAICFSLISHNGENLVKDPDVVWDYGGGDLVLVVYEEHRGASVSVWSQMWRWNNGSPALETAYGTSGYYQLSLTSGTYPNVDADYSEHAVAVWQDGGDIFAMTIEFNSLTPSGYHFWVNDGNCQQPGREPDVAMRNFQDEYYVSFVYVDPNNIEVIVSQEIYGTVQSSTSSCNYTPLQLPSGFVINNVGVPRIAMPNWDMTDNFWKDGWDAAVVYEGKTSSDYLIVTANRITHWSGWIPASWPWIPPYTWSVGMHTYSAPAHTSATGTEWISDILNVAGINLVHPASIMQINATLLDLNTSHSLRPVVCQSGDMITYNAWFWEDVNSHYSDLYEVLMRRLMLLNDMTLPFTKTMLGGDQLIGNFYIPAPTDRDYYLVSDGAVSGLNNIIVSISGTDNMAYFAFVRKLGNYEEIAFKRTIQSPNAAVRTAANNQIISQNKNNTKHTLIYPNPVQDELILQTQELIASIQITDLMGKNIWSKQDLNTKKYSINFIQNLWKEGIYIMHLTTINGDISNHKIYFKP